MIGWLAGGLLAVATGAWAVYTRPSTDGGSRQNLARENTVTAGNISATPSGNEAHHDPAPGGANNVSATTGGVVVMGSLANSSISTQGAGSGTRQH